MKLSDFPSEVRSALNEADDQWAEIEFSMKHAERALLHGDPGTGKTTLASNNRAEGTPLVRTMITPETSAAEVRGHWVIMPGGTEWIDGPGLRAWRTGARLVIDEIDQAGGDTIPLLHALLDDTAVASITLPDGSTVTPEKGFSCVATMNSDPVALPEALRDRFVIKHHVSVPKPIFMEQLPVQIRPFAAMSVYKKVALPQTLLALKSTRTWVEIGRLMGKSLGFADALRVIGIKNPMDLITATFGKMETANAA